jgi:hypothetical protein
MNNPAASSGVSGIAGSDNLPFMISGKIADCIDLGLCAPRGGEFDPKRLSGIKLSILFIFIISLLHSSS